ncbi:putative angiopoietin-1 receptor isoform X1 [Sesbania bispinosa]|nr:putative angiopoietin-1 receptor isoform X1 [Sesbania bispinosa]
MRLELGNNSRNGGCTTAELATTDRRCKATLWGGQEAASPVVHDGGRAIVGHDDSGGCYDCDSEEGVTCRGSSCEA